MFVVKFEYGIGSDGNTESCVEFDTLAKARKFVRDAMDEICDKIQNDIEVDNAIIRVWDSEAPGGLIADIRSGGRQK